MNVSLQAQNAYCSDIQTTRTDRSIEYDTFARITHRLKSARKGEFGTMAAAIHDNRRLWTTLASDVAGDDNALPTSLRAQILYLSEFTRQHSSKVLMRQATVDALIDVNVAIMGGLHDGGKTQ